MEPEPATPDDDLLEGLVEECLEHLVDDAEHSLESYRLRVPPARWPWFEGGVRSAQYLWRRAQGEDVRAEELLEQLSDDGREVFLEALATARLGAACLPLRIVSGMLIRGRYVILNELGTGGLASVFAAWDRDFENEVAIKFVRAEEAGSVPDWESIVAGECRFLAQLESRNIVRIYDVIRERERSFLVMDLVRGVDLSTVLEHLRASGEVGSGRVAALADLVGSEPEGERLRCLDSRSWPRTAARIATVIARTLALVHAKSIVHRDLKPANVMLVAGGEPVLLDFGLGTRAGSRAKGFHGTPGYIAPEQARGAQSGANPRTDIYQVGLILYELLTLRQAYPSPPGATVDTLLRSAAGGIIEPPRRLAPDVPPELDAICCKALAPETKNRYSSAAALATDLERFVRGLPPRDATIPRWRALHMRARYAARHPVGIVAAVGLVALAASPIVFGKDAWQAPAAVALLSDGSGATRIVVPGEALQIDADALLAIDVVCPDPAYLYAFSLYGSGGYEELYLKPVAPELLPLPEEPPPRRITDALWLEAGRHRVACASLRSPAEFEGLLLLFSENAHESLVEWRAALLRRFNELDPPRYPEALALASSLLGRHEKGDSPGDLTRDDRRLFSEKVSGSVPALLLTIDGISRIDWLFPVTPVTQEVR